MLRMLKGSATILFSFFIIIMNMQSGLHLLVYEIAKPIIIKNYCVNIDEPELHCDGKCHLRTVLLQEETNTSDETPNIPPPEIKFESTNYFTTIDKLEFNNDNFRVSSFDFSAFTFLYTREIVTDIFHPPTV